MHFSQGCLAKSVNNIAFPPIGCFQRVLGYSSHNRAKIDSILELKFASGHKHDSTYLLMLDVEISSCLIASSACPLRKVMIRGQVVCKNAVIAALKVTDSSISNLGLPTHLSCWQWRQQWVPMSSSTFTSAWVRSSRGAPNHISWKSKLELFSSSRKLGLDI